MPVQLSRDDGVGLAGTFLGAGAGAPVVVIVPGSGPTDRDGNNPFGVTAAPYRLLAEGLAARGIASLRMDKRGMFGSAAADVDANAVTLDLYAADVAGWVGLAAGMAGSDCVILAGHSEGGLISLLAGHDPRVRGVILLATPGRPLGDVLRAQLADDPDLAAAAERPLSELEAGRSVTATDLPAPLAGLFAAAVQPFLIDLMARDPVAMAASLPRPLMILQGDHDLQVGAADLAALRSARPDAQAFILPGVNHVLKVAPPDRAGNLAVYADADAPLDRALVDHVAAFVGGFSDTMAAS